MVKSFIIIGLASAAFVCSPPARGFQKGGRETAPAKEPPKPIASGGSSRSKQRGKHGPTGQGTRAVNESGESKGVGGRPAFGEIVVNVSPPDSTVLFNGVEQPPQNGALVRTGLAPGAYKIVVRKAGYREQEQQLIVAAGDRWPLNITLVPSPGTVSVVTTVADAVIVISNAETGDEVGQYHGRATDVELPPGRYQVVVSKSGYHTVVRDIAVEPAGKIYLEPPLEPLPKPVDEPRRGGVVSFRPDSATQLQVAAQGKFLIVNLGGRSGNSTSPAGSVDVTLMPGSGSVSSVTGMLTGFPCQVDFVRLENVAEYSFVEAPGVSNQWGRVVVRVRPKDSKRAIHFLVNWKSLQ